MNYKCIPYADGVDVSINSSSFFTFKIPTHLVTDLGGGKVRISRKIDNLIELYSEPVANFVDINSVPVATNYQELYTYFNTERGIKAGEGIAVTGRVVSQVAGGPSTLGGFKVGTGLTVDGSGRLSASATSEVTKVLATEAEMLALPTESLRSYRVIRLDTKRLYYLNAETTPSVLANWFVGPSIEAVAVSFQGRSGAIVSEFGDYNFDLIPLKDKSTNTDHKIVIDDGVVYIENIETSEKLAIAYASDVGDIVTRLTTIEDIVTSQANGLVKKVNELQSGYIMLNDSVNNVGNGLITRVTALENSLGGTDYSAQISALQAKDVDQDSIINEVDTKVDSVAANNVVIDQRVTTLENRPAGTDYSPQIAALQNKDTAQDTRISANEAALLSKAGLVAGKVPYEQLPEFPVGRKVNVADRAARLGLVMYTDLTIAYQSDTGDAWGLDANDDPAIDSNWSMLGNAQALGVASFNGRTGQIGSASGDYNSGQITELADKRFVSEAQITEWNAKETTTGSQTKATVVKDYADVTFINKSQMAVSGGVATLGSDGKVLPSQLSMSSTPRVWRDAKTTRIVAGWISNRTGVDMVVYIASTSSTVATRQISVLLRQPDISGAFTFKSPSVGIASDKTTTITVIVPNGCDYQVSASGGTSLATIDTWLELS